MAKRSKIAGLKAEREKLETTDAVRLQQRLARAICEHCGQRPKVYCTRGDTRYVKCACGRRGTVNVERGILRWKQTLTEEEFEAVFAAQDAGEPAEANETA